MSEFDVKTYQGKDRVYLPVAGRKNISRLYVWDGKKYFDPPSGKKYDTRRIEISENGKRKRKKMMFKTLEEACLWQQGNDASSMERQSAVTLGQYVRSISSAKGMTVEELIAEFKLKHFTKVNQSTRVRYERLLNLNFSSLSKMVVKEFKPQVVDLWLHHLKMSEKSPQRKFYKHELDMLKTLMEFYKEYYDEDNEFILPFRKRHRSDAQNGHVPVVAPDLSLESFYKFRENLLSLKHGGKLWLLTTIQFFQALRISEIAAVHFEDFMLNRENPSLSRVRFSRAVKWKKNTNTETTTGSLKNAQYIGGDKEHPVFPETFLALTLMYPDFEKRKGPIFLNDDGQYFEYRQLQNAFDRAFELAKLDYTGSHILRHGGCRLLLNETGDRYVAQQHLGNSSVQSTDVYAKRASTALTEAVERRWGVVSGGKS